MISYPAPPNGKVPKFDGNNSYCCSAMGVVCTRGEKTQAIRAKRSIIETVIIMSLEAHRNCLL